MTYHCSVCGKQLKNSGTGLKTFRCPQHPFRFTTVIRDLSGGKEADRINRASGISVKRGTKVVVK